MRFLFALAFALAANISSAQQGLVAAIKQKGDILMLAKVVSIGAASEVTETPGTGPAEHVRYRALVLEPIDVFLGRLRGPITVGVPASEVDLAAWIVGPHEGSWGFSGRGPLGGLLVGDISIWAVQLPKKGVFSDLGWYPYLNTKDAPQLPEVSASAFEGLWAAMPTLVQGKGVVGPARQLKVPKYEPTLEGVLRYADVVGRSAVEQAMVKPTSPFAWEYLDRLMKLKETFDVSDPWQPKDSAVLPKNQLTQWFEKRVVADWPKDDVNQLNITAIRMLWENPKPIEPEFLALIHKCGRKKLGLMFLPPITNEEFFVEECENPEGPYAAEGFVHARTTKSRNKRVTLAAIKWLTAFLERRDAAETVTARNAGLDGDILWWLADTTGKKDLTADWTKPSPEILARARLVAQELLTQA